MAKPFEESQCVVCENWFLTTAVDGQGRCKHCAEHDCEPGTAKEQESIKSDKKRRQDLKDLVRELMLELQEEKRIEKEQKKLKIRKCKKCDNEFIPRAPANTICASCQDKERAERKLRN